MKKILIVAATAGLISLTACGGGATNNTAEAIAENHEANAAMYEDMADEASNAAVENALENAADASENAADAVVANAN